jgi:Uma2 family endonuclease
VNVGTDLLTFAEFVNIPDPPVGFYELHHGRLVLMPPRKKSHVKVQQALLDLLTPHARGRGFLTVEFPFRPAPEYECWAADVAFVGSARWERDENDYFLGAPDLVIEVLSESNTMDAMLDRQQICLANGCTAFWVVDAKRRIILVTNPAGITVTFDASSSVPLPETFGTKERVPVSRAFGLE